MRCKFNALTIAFFHFCIVGHISFIKLKYLRGSHQRQSKCESVFSEVAGVDLIRPSPGPLVLKVNSSPGLRGIEEATGVNVAGKIIKYIEENLGSAKSRRKDKG